MGQKRSSGRDYRPKRVGSNPKFKTPPLVKPYKPPKLPKLPKIGGSRRKRF